MDLHPHPEGRRDHAVGGRRQDKLGNLYHPAQESQHGQNSPQEHLSEARRSGESLECRSPLAVERVRFALSPCRSLFIAPTKRILDIALYIPPRFFCLSLSAFLLFVVDFDPATQRVSQKSFLCSTKDLLCHYPSQVSFIPPPGRYSPSLR